ncbi:DUF4114 domain-containing protein [Aquabacter sp. CN5-332]|uniref:DUF4114 domain-containing protein n=1 Tax=Aquabacter sp. CN5-332 TaxID=3156608 RepID=UPI0032B3F067
MPQIPNSSFLDFSAWNRTTTTDVPTAYGYADSDAYTVTGNTVTMTVGLTLERANDPSALLSADWADRQKSLALLNASGTLWNTFGADAGTYATVAESLKLQGITILGSDEGYVSSPESRTIWVQLDSSQFNQLFGTPLLGLRASDNTGDMPNVLYWDGNLSLSQPWASAISGLWVDYITSPNEMAMPGTNTPATPKDGAQVIGNYAATSAVLYPDAIAKLYNFPLTDSSAVTDPLALVEPLIGAALPAGSFQDLLNSYLAKFTNAQQAGYYVVGAPQQWLDGGTNSGERSLDVGVVAGINPGSQVGLYTGSSFADMSYYTAFQGAIWDLVNNPGVISSSYTDWMSNSPDSPFLAAYRELFVDAALRNIAAFTAAGDVGSSHRIANGLPNVLQDQTSLYGIMVGGTSLSTLGTALDDPTLSHLVSRAKNGNLDVLHTLVQAGLKDLPHDDETWAVLVETVWNRYKYDAGIDTLNPGFNSPVQAGGGGVDTTQPTPGYQTDYGLHPISAGPDGGTGRGVPDVSAASGGNLRYDLPSGDMTSHGGDIGTSAATPLWAALTLQIQTIFEDQGLPRPGYMNDLLYIAAVVAPASFNDITIGNNTSSYFGGGSTTSIIYNEDGSKSTSSITPTGYGYEAGQGYDYATGLGTPNGLLLARALTAIAHAQWSFDTPGVLAGNASTGWTGGVSESLIFQSTLSSESQVSIGIDGTTLSFDIHKAGAYAWSNQFAQQVLQPDFSSDLVTAFDQLSHGRALQANIDAGASLSVEIGGMAASAPQASLSNPYGFVTFGADAGEVQVARVVAVAQTVDAADDQTAVVRMRQNGTQSNAVLFYRVDDYAGTIDGLKPGDAGYEAAAHARAYQTTEGHTWVEGAGYGKYAQAEITGVNGGDLIAMELMSDKQVFSAFAQANETGADGLHVGHIWNYGLNTWGWEDQVGGGDLDYNDLVVQLDFTSATGHQWLV